MAAQRQRARAAWKGGDEVAALDVYRSVLDVTGPTEFVGYEVEMAEGQVLAIVDDGEAIERADHGREVEVFLSRTPFTVSPAARWGTAARSRPRPGRAWSTTLSMPSRVCTDTACGLSRGSSPWVRWRDRH